MFHYGFYIWSIIPVVKGKMAEVSANEGGKMKTNSIYLGGSIRGDIIIIQRQELV